MGAFAAVSREIKDYLINRARSFIFSTALLPMDDRREHLRKLGHILHNILQPLSPDFTITPSHIQPMIIGEASRTVEASMSLREEGFKVLPIRTPTVPPGTERLRISLSAALTVEDIARFGEALKQIMASL